MNFLKPDIKTPDTKKRELRLQAILILAVAILWFPAKNIYFIGDDFTLLTEQLVNPFSLFTVSAQFIMPVFKAFLAIGGMLFGGSVSGYHFLILLIHIFNVLMFYRILLRFDDSRIAAFLSALIWGTLPQYAESIFWITGSVHTITLFFVFSAFLLFLKWYDEKKPVFLVLSLILSVLAFYTKETAVVLLFIAGAYLYHEKRSFKKALSAITPHLALFVAMIAANQIIRHSMGIQLTGYYSSNISDYLKYICYYTAYNLFGFQVFPGFLISALIVLSFILGLYFLRRTRYFIYISLYLLTLIPFVVVAKAPQRYSYITALWLFPPIVIALKDYFLQQKNRILRYSVLPLVILFMLVSIVRLRIEYLDYKNFGDMHRLVVKNTQTFIEQNSLADNTYYIFVNDRAVWTPFLINKNMRGFKKLWAIRDKGVADLIYLDDLLNFCVQTEKNSQLYKNRTLVSQTDRNKALGSIKKGNYYLIRYDYQSGILGAKFNAEGMKIMERTIALPEPFIPYLVKKTPDNQVDLPSKNVGERK
jgi:hypothetical protein